MYSYPAKQKAVSLKTRLIIGPIPTLGSTENSAFFANRGISGSNLPPCGQIHGELLLKTLGRILHTYNDELMLIFMQKSPYNPKQYDNKCNYSIMIKTCVC